MRIVLFGNNRQREKSRYVSRIVERLQVLDVDVLVEEEFREFLLDLGAIAPTLPALNGRLSEADMVISVGGDGTFLSTAAKVGAHQIPILGVNTGHLGFLADVSPEDIDESLERLVNGQYTVQERNVIQVEKEGSPLENYPFALNEVAVTKHEQSSVIAVETRVNGELLNNYLADGLIVCTPTGSTGYSLSVGGPIIDNTSESLCISAVAPHAMSVRPVILRDDVEITLRVKSRTNKFLIAVDGRCESHSADTLITLRKADYKVRVVKIQHPSFFDTLRDRMLWGK